MQWRSSSGEPRSSIRRGQWPKTSLQRAARAEREYDTAGALELAGRRRGAPEHGPRDEAAFRAAEIPREIFRDRRAKKERPPKSSRAKETREVKSVANAKRSLVCSVNILKFIIKSQLQ